MKLAFDLFQSVFYVKEHIKLLSFIYEVTYKLFLTIFAEISKILIIHQVF